MPVACENAGINCVGYGDIANGAYAVHIVNNGATRSATLSGLPTEVKQLHIYVTDSERGMAEGKPVPVVEGVAQFTLGAMSFTTVMNRQFKN